MSGYTIKKIEFSLIALILVFISIVPVSANAPTNLSLPSLRVVSTQPDTMDPQRSSFVQEIAHAKLIYEGLTRLDANLQPAPGAAASWEISVDKLQVVFNLRSNLKYSDGSLLNAKRFEYSILRTLDPATASEYGSLLDLIAGAIEYRSANPASPANVLNTLRSNVGVKALDTNGASCTSYTQANCTRLKITLSAPNPALPSIMSLWVTYPAREEMITSGGANWWSNPAKQIGNGPFILSIFANNGHSLFQPNPYYWRGVPTYTLDYVYINDTAQQLTSYKKAEVDITTLAPEDMAQVAADPLLSQEVHAYPGSCTFGIFLNNGKAPFTDPKVRQAFAYAFNRQAWVDQVLQGNGVPTLTWIPQGMPGYDATESRWAYSPTKAVQALNASTYGGVQNLPAITLTFSDTPRNRVRHEWLAAQWKTVLGVDAKLNPVEPTLYTQLTQNPATAPQTFILGWCGDYPDPSDYLSIYWRSTSAYAKRINYANAQVDTLLDQADREQDPTTRMALYQQAQSLIIGDAPAIMAWNDRHVFMVKPHVQGAMQTSLDAWMGDVDPLSITLDMKTVFMPALLRQ